MRRWTSKLLRLIGLRRASALMDLARRGEEEALAAALARLMKRGAGRSALESDATAGLLCHACEAGWPRVAELLLGLGADPNRLNAEPAWIGQPGGSPLRMACGGEGKSVACARILLAGGADPNLECRYGSPLAGALGRSDLTCAELLLAAGARPRSTARFCLVGDAALSGNLPALRMLMDLGVCPEGANPLGSPLTKASSQGHLDCVATLLAAGADVNAVECSSGASALAMAARSGQCEAARLLLQAGAPIDSVDQRGMTPLGEAACRGRAACVDLLLALGAQPNRLVVRHERLTPLMLAASAGHGDCVHSLLRGGANPLHEDPEGRKILGLAHAHSRYRAWDARALSLAHDLGMIVKALAERRALGERGAPAPASPALPKRL